MQRIDLAEVAATLRADVPASDAGLRKRVVVKQGSVSIVLFAFDKGGQLKEHQADGEVIVQVLRGQLTVTVAGENVSLVTGQLLMIAPGERHAVEATEESDMLLCIARRHAQ
jgi:quercetin dioxygenase-like cupin family protein